MADTAQAVRQSGPGDSGSGYCSGSPFMVSGELFLRSTQSLLFNSGGGDLVGPSSHPHHRVGGGSTDTAAQQHPSAALLAGLSPDLRDLLLCHPDVSATDLSATADADNGGLCRLVSSARAERRAVRRKRIEYLKTSKAIAGYLATARLNAVQRAGEGFRKGCAQGSVQLDSRLRALVLRFASAVSAEMAAEDAQTAAEGRYCQRETERLELAARLASLAATAEHRTRGSVLLRRLPPTHPQHARCLRAATENVKPGFFSSKSPYGAVQVLDIYKIENRILLERFQRAAEATGPCKVKGLFCRVPDESLEHVVLYGMGGAGVLMDDCGVGRGSGAAPFSVAGWDGDPVDLFGAGGGAPTKVSARRGGGSAGERGVHGGGGGKRPLEFPRAFSRHSTLEEEHGYANSRRGCDDDDDDDDDDGEGREVRRHRRPCSPPPPADSRPPQRRHRLAGEGGPAEDQRHGAAVSGLRFLALCRVMIGSMHVATVPSPETTARRKGGGGGDSGGDSGGSTSPHGSHSPRDSTGSPATKRLQGASSSSSSSCSSGADPGALRPLALPPPPPGQAEFDSVYFPREEEYRLLNEAFVLPEFLVVHRFVAATAAPSGHASRSTGSFPAGGSTGGAAASASDEGEEGHRQAAVDGVSAGDGKGDGAKRAAEKRGERGGQQQPRHQQSGRAKGEPAPPPTQDAASVVAEIEAAVQGMALPQGNKDLPRGGRDGGGGGGSGGSAPCEAAAAPFSGGGDSASSRSGEIGAANGGSDGDGQGEGRGRQRGGGRAFRDSVLGDVVLEFERHWQDMGRLREAEKSEVAKTAVSRRKLRQPP